MTIPFENLGMWFWRLLPGNPILVRVVGGKSRRPRHLWLRFIYLGALVGVVMISLMSSGSSATSSLSDLARGASQTFRWASIVQLALMCVLAPVFTADAITQERDAQTYNILLTTPLSNAQIVLGSLLSRLFFVVTLLLSGLPVFLLTTLYGGVTTSQIVESFVIAGSTALITGSLAISVSMIRVGTRRTIFSFYLLIGTYLLAVYAFGQWNLTRVPEAPTSVTGAQMSWLAAFHPFLCMQVALNQVQAPDVAHVAHYGRLAKYFIAYPHTMYVVLSTLSSVVLILVSLFFVRRSAKEGESNFWTKVRGWFTRGGNGERHRTPRAVWRNPVAWREAATRASALSRGFLTYALVGGGLLTAILLLAYYGNGTFTARGIREWLHVVVLIEFATILLIATNTAATAITKERESNTMDLLLCTPLTSRYIVWGKLRGLVSFAVPLICVPVASLLLFALYDVVRRAADPAVFIETALEVGVLMVIYTAFACMIGMDRSLKNKKTVQAVMVSVGLLVVLCLATWAIWSQIIKQADEAGALLGPFTPITALETLVNPTTLFDGNSQALADAAVRVRVLALFGSAMAAGVVALIVAGMYKSMVRNFDMIVRKQSAT
ncbi:MAG: ABC transporter permease subunit [Phycisphaerae bacterium]|nr:ABC transporter permease subunit [Phycisphaerae bacterium]